MRNCLETQASKMKGHFTRRREPPLSVHSRDLEGKSHSFILHFPGIWVKSFFFPFFFIRLNY
jgi:hypothetical protein